MLEKFKQNPKFAQWKTEHPNANALIILVGIVMIWRGIWNLLDRYLFPNAPFLSCALSIALGAVLLYLDDFSVKNLKR